MSEFKGIDRMKAYEYLLKHSQELSKKYPGKYLAIVDDKVVAISYSGHDAFVKAKNYIQKEKFI